MDDGRIAVETTEGGDFGDLVVPFVMHVEEVLHSSAAGGMPAA